MHSLWEFLLTLYTTILVDHAAFNLVAAVGVCVASSYLAFYSLWMARAGAQSGRGVWCALSVLSLGVGAWSTLFLAMLGFRPDVALGFRVDLTALSGVVALAGVGGALTLSAISRASLASATGGAAAALCALGMHALGVLALSNGLVAFDFRFGAAAMGGAALAFALAVDRVRYGRQRGAAMATLLFSGGLVWLHFVSLAGARIDVFMTPGRDALLRSDLEPLVVIGVVVMMAATLATMRLQRQGERQRDRMAAVAAAMADGAALLDERGGVVWMNPALRRRIGEARVDDAHALTAALFGDRAGAMDRAFQAGLRADIEEGLRAGRRLTTDIAADGETGDRALLQLTLAPAHDAAGRSMGHVLTLRDVSEDRRRESRLAAERDAAQSVSAAKSQLMAVASHELRTPLNGVLGLAELLKRHVAGPQGDRMLGQLTLSAQRLNALLDDVLEYSDGPGPARRENCAPDALAAALRRRHGPAAQARGLRFGVSVDRALGDAVHCDPKALMRALGRLIDNAIAYTPAGEVTVSLRRGGWNDMPALVCVVEDTGPGLDEDALMAAIDGFQGANVAVNRRQGGLGLGLALTRRGVAAMQGLLRFERLDPGCRVSIILPGATEIDAGAYAFTREVV